MVGSVMCGITLGPLVAALVLGGFILLQPPACTYPCDTGGTAGFDDTDGIGRVFLVVCIVGVISALGVFTTSSFYLRRSRKSAGRYNSNSFAIVDLSNTATGVLVLLLVASAPGSPASLALSAMSVLAVVAVALYRTRTSRRSATFLFLVPVSIAIILTAYSLVYFPLTVIILALFLSTAIEDHRKLGART